MTYGPKPKELIDRFLAKVTFAANACWEWQNRTHRGYGQIYTKAGTKYANRISYELFRGEVGALHVLHTCDNTLCVNPAHLFLGTHDENMADMTRKGRSNRGPDHWNYKQGRFIDRYKPKEMNWNKL